MKKKAFILALLFMAVFVLVSCEKTEKSYTLEEVEEKIEIIYGDGDQVNYVTQNIILPTTSTVSEDVEIEWYSLYPAIISTEGSVTRSDSDKNVVLTYTIIDGDDVLYGNITLTVIGLNDSSMYKITFDSQGGSEVEALIVYEGDLVTQPDDPEKEGYQFVGWYTTENFTRTFDFEVMPSGDTTIYAKWNYIDENIYTITFDTNGGSSVEPLSENGGVRISAPANPTKEGYDFAGWYSDQDLVYAYDISYMPYGNLVLYARWREAVSYDGYYEGADTLVGDNLVSFLNTIINTGFSGVTYGEARYILDETDRDPNNSSNLILVYEGTSVSGTWDAGSTWNREHVWPQSKLGVSADNSKVNVASDLHNLKPADPGENSSRSNDWFGATSASNSYEPRDDVKGDIARILFYMDIMYDNLVLVEFEGNEEAGTYEMGDLSTLLEWHLLDPVDEFEINRNNVIYTYQGNRNPFIDHPEFVDKIYN